MVCTDSEYCVLESNKPETKSGNFFPSKKDNVLVIAPLKDIVDSILNNEPVLHWDHREIKNLNEFGITLIVKVQTSKI